MWSVPDRHALREVGRLSSIAHRGPKTHPSTTGGQEPDTGPQGVGIHVYMYYRLIGAVAYEYARHVVHHMPRHAMWCYGLK